MSIFGGQQSAARGQQNLLDPRAKIQELQKDPAATLAQAGFNIPAGMTDPSQILAQLQRQARPGVVQTALRMLGGNK